MKALLVAGLGTIWLLGTAHAAGMSKQTAEVWHGSCVSACEQSSTRDWCRAYCNCAMERTLSDLSEKEHSQFGTAMLFGGEIDPAVATKFREIILSCASQVSH